MDRRSWLWRRKSQENSSETQSQWKINTIDQEGLRVGSNLNEKLNDAFSTISSNQELLKKHIQIAEEAVAGWEHSQTEVETLKDELEMSLQNNSSLKDQIENLEIALKECLKKFEESQKIQDEIFDENNKKTEILEKENSDLKTKLSILVDENNLVRKQYLESVKRGNNFESECIKLQTLLDKNELENNNNGTRKINICSLEIELMDDFLEMEKLVSLLETQNSEKEFELHAKLEKFEREKTELELEIDKLHEKDKLLEIANFEVVKMKNELDVINEKIKEEKAVSLQFETKYRELEAWIAKLNDDTKLKQERKLSECQNTIASLNKQLNFLTNFEEFMEENVVLGFNQDSEYVDCGDDKIIHVVNTA